MPWIIVIFLVILAFNSCGTTSVKDDPLGLMTEKPNKEQLLNRQLYDQAVQTDRLESCLRYMQKKSGGNERDCPK